MHIVMFAADTPATLCQDKHKDNDLHLPAELLNSCQSLLIKITILIVDLYQPWALLLFCVTQIQRTAGCCFSIFIRFDASGQNCSCRKLRMHLLLYLHLHRKPIFLYNI